jgi:ubiquinol-cytochrome c reductase cytochrome c subunit
MLPFVLAGIIAITSPGGRAAYQQLCASCHGADLRGGPSAPSIRGIGAATVDFWVGTGRMPAAVPWVEVGHRGLQMSQATENAIVAYVTSVQPGGTPIPIVTTDGDPQRGMQLFRENCMHCHGADAQGAAIGDRQWAPSLERASVTQVAEAIRIGPSEMPVFGEAQLTPRDVDDIATYLSHMHATGGAHGLPVRSSGPVPEGLLGWIAAGLLALLAYAFSSRTQEKETTA